MLKMYLRYNTKNVWRTMVGFFLCAVMVGGVTTAHAQFLMPNPGFSLQTDPKYPTPGESYRVFIHGRVNSGTPIAWRVNGVEAPVFADKTEAILTTPNIATPVRISATVAIDSRRPITLEKTFAVGIVDTYVEGDTLIPAFYAGRPLPSRGSTARIVAIPNLFSAAGNRLDPTNLTYQWRMNGVTKAEGVGQQSFTTSIGTGASTIGLVVKSSAGDVLYETAEEIRPAPPTLSFYEKSALYGLSPIALRGEHGTSQDELRAQAVPYFTSRDILDNAQYQWTLDGSPIENPSASPFEITLRRSGAGGAADVGFSIRNLESLLQHAEGLFRIHFEGETNTQSI